MLLLLPSQEIQLPLSLRELFKIGGRKTHTSAHPLADQISSIAADQSRKSADPDHFLSYDDQLVYLVISKSDQQSEGPDPIIHFHSIFLWEVR